MDSHLNSIGAACFGPLGAPTRTTDVVYAVAGGIHVTILIDATETGGMFDLVEVLAPPGGEPSPHRHEFAEWFHVVDGMLQFLAPSGGTLKSIALVEAGGTYVVPPWAPHTAHNITDTPARFIVAGQPGVMSSYYAEAGARVRDTQTRPAVSPADQPALAEMAARHHIHILDPEAQ